MNQVLEWLSGGDLRSDGMANEVVDFVLNHLEIFEDLYDGLSQADDVVRGRAADALEKIARSRPDLYVNRIPELIRISRDDKLPMVRWHIAMTLGHLAGYPEKLEEISQALLDLLKDESVFVKSWAIVSLCIIGRKYLLKRETIVKRIVQLQKDDSIAIRSKARNALNLLTDDNAPFPEGWIKSKHLKHVGF